MARTLHDLDAATARELAVEARCDPRTIRKVLAGAPVRGLARRRAASALTAAGFRVPGLLPVRAAGGE